MGAMYRWSDDDAVDAEARGEAALRLRAEARSRTRSASARPGGCSGHPADEREVRLSKPQRGLDAAVVDDVLSNRERPVWLDPTVRSGPDGYTVYVVTLAWGVHRMLRNLFANEEQAKGAEATARALFGL